MGVRNKIERSIRAFGKFVGFFDYIKLYKNAKNNINFNYSNANYFFQNFRNL